MENQPTLTHRYLARLARAGQVQAADGAPADLVIEAAALRQAVAAGKFEACAVFVDHAGPWENQSLDRLVGVASQASFDGESVNSLITLLDRPGADEIAALIDAVLALGGPGASGGGAPDVGLSIVFWPKYAPRAGLDEPRRVVEIRKVESVDFVFQPAADGRILQDLTGRGDPGPNPAEAWHAQVPWNQPGNTRLVLAGTILSKDGGTQMNEETKQNLQAGERPTSVDAPQEADAPAPQDGGEEASLQDDPYTTWYMALQKATRKAILGASGLPHASRVRLESMHFDTPDELEMAIIKERGYVAELGSGKVVQVGATPPRSPQIAGMRDSLDRIGLALEALISGVHPPDGVQPLSGIREAYHLLSGDYEMSGLYHGERVAFANVTSSTMANLVANVLNKRLVNEFQGYPQWWAPVVSIEDFTSLQDVRWITLGGVGELPTVAEGAAYTELTWDDKYESSSFVKKGGYLGITLEAIDKDDTGRIRAAPRALAQAAWLTLARSISAIFTAGSGVGPTLSDSYALFHTNHANLGTSALSMTSWAAARLAMRKQTELNSAERLGALTAPRYLLVPPDLEITALQILASEADYTYALSNGVAAPANAFADGDSFQARMNAARGRVIVVDLWTDANDWAAAADPRLYPTIGLGFRYGRTPEIFSVASPTAGLMFSNDTMPIKVRFFFAVGPMDYRGLYKANV